MLANDVLRKRDVECVTSTDRGRNGVIGMLSAICRSWLATAILFFFNLTGFASRTSDEVPVEVMFNRAGELQTLAEAGIASIGLASAAPAEPTAVGGNQIARTGSFTRTDGSTGNVADVAFQINETASQWFGDDIVSAGGAALPQLRGFGTVEDLRVANDNDVYRYAPSAEVVG